MATGTIHFYLGTTRIAQLIQTRGLSGPMTTIFAALWLGDNVGSFFAGGGAAFYHSPIQPQGIQSSLSGLGLVVKLCF